MIPRTILRTVIVLIALSPPSAGLIGAVVGSGILHPANLNPERLEQAAAMLQRTGATKEDFTVRASDGINLQGWKVRPASMNGDWVLLFHGVSDNRTGMLGPAEFLLRHAYSIVMMDARGHGKSGGDMVTYGSKERYDTVAIVNALEAGEHVRHLFALGVSMGAAVALQSAALNRASKRWLRRIRSQTCAKLRMTTPGWIFRRCSARRSFVLR